MVAALVFLLIYYFGWARRHFKGPQVMGDLAHMTEIEREFEVAAGHVSACRHPHRPWQPDRAGRRAGWPADHHRRGSSMSETHAKHPRLEELEAMVRDGRIDTLVVAITDMQGRLMGKRVQAQAFLEGVIDHGAHFCTYLLGTDMEMNTPEGFSLMNWETGYGDWIASPVWDTLRVLPWLEKTALVLSDTIDEETHTEIPVSPRTILKRQVARAAERGFRSRPDRSSSTTCCATHGMTWPARASCPRSDSAPTTRTTTCSRRPRPSRSIDCCAIR